MTNLIRIPILFFLLFVLSACQNVKPWERGILAKPEMQLDVNKLGGDLYNQVYYSKEASSGGGRVAGAGCGCK